MRPAYPDYRTCILASTGITFVGYENPPGVWDCDQVLAPSVIAALQDGAQPFAPPQATGTRRYRDIDRAVEILATAQRMAADGLAETRRAVHALRADARPLDEELRRVTSVHGERYGIEVTFGVGGVARPLPPDATLALLRTAQEALVNAAKHAPGRDVAVHLDYSEHDVRLTVVNDLASGRVAATAATGTVSGGYGLTGMHERLRLLNGTLAAGPCGGRWVVTAELPLAPALQPQDVAS